MRVNRARGHCFHGAVVSTCFRDTVALVARYKANMTSYPAKATASGVEEESMDTSTSGARWLSGRMPDSQSREPGFESPLIPFRSLGIFFHDASVDSAV